MKKKFIDTVLFAFIASIYITYSILIPLYRPDFFEIKTAKIEFTIPYGASAKNAAKIIKDAGVISDSELLIKWMIRLKIDRKLQPGKYTIHKSSEINVAYELQTAKPQVEQLMVIPGTKYETLIKYFINNNVDLFTKEILNDSNFPKDMRPLLPEKARDRIAFLLPETYLISPGEKSAKQFIKNSSKLWFELIGKDLSVTNKELENIAILASIVEGEAKVNEERPILAGIFLNRIQKNMKLQSCATVIYCWENKGIKKSSLTYKDLEIVCPYNTYLYYGLPPGPICIPSADSWTSALNPQNTEYLFFFATIKGNHIFSKTYQEHLSKQNQILNTR